MVFHTDENFSRKRERRGGGHLGFGIGSPEVWIDPHDFAGGLHLRSENDVDPREAAEGKDGLLDAVVLRMDFGGEAKIGEFFAGHDLGGEFGKRDADGLGDEGDGAGGARVDLDDEELVVFDCELDVHQAADLQGLRQGLGRCDYLFRIASESENGGMQQALSPE